jgi:predicted MFS family arabinose efflux permease
MHHYRPIPTARVRAPSPIPSNLTTSQWLAALSLGATAFIMVTIELLPIGLLPTIAADIDVTHGAAGLLVTMSGVMAAVGAPTISVLAGRTDRKVVLMALSVQLAVSSLLAAAATSFSVLLVARFLLGLAIGGFWTMGISLGPRLLPEPTGTRGATLVFAGVALGTIAGLPVGTILGGLIGWRWAFGAAAVVSVLLVLLQAFFVPSLPVQHAVRWHELLAIWRIPQARLGLLMAFALFFGQFFAYTYIAPFLGQVSRLSDTAIGAVLLLMGVTGFFGNLLGGRTASRDVRRDVGGAALLIAVPVLLLVLAGSSPVAATILVGVWGVGLGALPIGLQTWTSRAAPAVPEASAVVFVSMVQLAIASGSVSGGLIVDHLGVVSAMLIGGLLVAMAVPIAWVFGQQTVSSAGA